jgi:hypothetical protein
MNKSTKTAIFKYLAIAGMIAVIWSILSIVLILMLAGAEDNPDMNAVTPHWLKVAVAITSFPMCYLRNWNWAPIVMSGTYVVILNGIFWGLLLTLLTRFVARFLFRDR